MLGKRSPDTVFLTEGRMYSIYNVRRYHWLIAFSLTATIPSFNSHRQGSSHPNQFLHYESILHYNNNDIHHSNDDNNQMYLETFISKRNMYRDSLGKNNRSVHWRVRGYRLRQIYPTHLVEIRKLRETQRGIISTRCLFKISFWFGLVSTIV